MSRFYTRKEIRDFYENMHTSVGGVYSIHVPTWNEMLKQDTLYCNELECKYMIDKLDKRFPIKPHIPWANTEKEQMYVDRIFALESSCNTFPWLQFLLGVLLGIAFMLTLLKIFGG
ncbi:hypothetical protein VPHG_00177 [Vibrio phage 11895-B1]|uniref:hypothetical protein n=1 Tax=Vibrio phage 11895-B1 TaxID=754075 RepID=UPI0002C1471A|nr:hypothetical protein VPHG_00177 [Vibrio phage 11895-B1]AGH32240.1 hypothetical protein VPHG_00177 [Vibrio phage 11895-B1]